ncbi:putative Ig domain-containing protein [Reinekea sp. G2M2-21]|uniref:Ig-like domain-containing protein n=1 Tax=Reinekea sp. G2M2-21 TaxID=2788942 RepID=UPI0018AB3F86|nr:putative Ig domain-containing protein [Reinekea sp. G2M2-21]
MLFNPRVLGVFPAAVLLISTVMAEPFVETPQITIEPDFCSLYPITLEDTTFEGASIGEQFPALSLGTGPGNYNWLSWNGTNNAPSQEARLIPPGNSNTYVNPNDGLDNQINVGDWVQGTPGVKNSNGIRTQMDALINQHIIIPLYSSYEGSGTNLNYQVSKFAVVKLLDYKLNGKGYVSLEYVRHTRCYNNRPVANDQIIEVLEDHTIDIRLLYSDDDSDQLAVSEHSNTQFGSLAVYGLALTAHYSPNQNYYGDDSFVFTLHDGEQLSNQAQVRIRVIPVNDAPVAVGQTVTGLEDSLIKLTFDASDIDSSQLTFEPSLNNQIGQILEENGEYFYQPPANFSGDITLTYQAYDGELYSNVADLLVRVLPVNDSPVALGLTLDVEQGASVQFLPEVTDIDSDSYVLETVSHPETGTLVINGNQVIYTADSDFEGQVSWLYRANDLAIGEFDEGTNLSNTATVTINVLKINEPPVITSSAIELTDENSTYQYQVIAEDPNERDVLSYELSFAPHNMSIDSLTGRIDWTPDSSWVQSVPDFNKQCYVVPTGSAKVYEEGDEDNALTYVAPLFQQVKRALEHASDYTGERTVAWDRKEKCLGCHIQTQTLLGLQASLGKADVDLNSAEFLLEELLSSQQSDGSIRQSHPQYSKTQTAFALWSLSYVTDFERTLEKRGRALRFMMDRQSTNGDQIYWSQDHSSGWMRDYDSITSVIALSGARFIKDLKKIDSPTSELQNYADAFQDNVDKIVNFELARAFGNDNETLWLAFRQIALAELRPLVSDATRLVEIDNAINWLDNTLRSRQLPVGGWSRYSYGSSADPLTSAWVGLALNYLDPALTDSAVINNIKYLLESQSANGTWVTTSGLFNTHLATTSLVMAYLPVALEHLGNPDVYAGTIHLVEGESGSHQLTAKISNRGLADITSELLIQFFNGEGENELLGTTTLNRLLSGEQATASINVEDSALTDHVYVTITSASDADECEITNNKTHAALVRVKASDPDEEFDTQVFTLNVLDVNEAPVIISDAPLTHQGGQGLVYQVQVADNDEGDGHQFTLMNAPDNVYIDQNTGKLTAAPGTLAPGDYTVVVQVTDLRGETDTQTITFTVFANEPPQIVSIAVSEGLENGGYEYDVDAIDPNNDELEYALEIFPQGSWINKNSGLLNWVGRSEFVEPTTTANEFCVSNTALNIGDFEPVLKWQNRDNKVLSLPVVAPLIDSNNDGAFDENDEPVVLVNQYSGFVDSASGNLVALNGKTGEQLWAQSSSTIKASSSIAVANVMGDAAPEIFYYDTSGYVTATDYQGNVLWRNTDARVNDRYNYGAITIADLNADGEPEILAKHWVLSAQGDLLWVSDKSIGHRASAIAVDTNGDGTQEVVMGGYLYSADGQLLADFGMTTSYNAVANMDGDDDPELVAVFGGAVSVFNFDGTRVWGPTAIPGGGGGSPTVSDLDGDGLAEVGVSGRSVYVVFDDDGSVLWQATVQDYSSRTTGSTVFDFDADGDAEIVYADERNLRIFDGATGKVEFSVPNTSATAAEYPVVADIDSDGHAEILVTSDGGSSVGIRAFEDLNDSWAPTRKLWNQYNYHINNINDDLTVPATPVTSWLTHNTFRLNAFPDRPALGMADVTVHNIRFIENTNTVTADIVNRGLAPITQPMTVSFTHEHHWTGDTALGTATINALAIGETQTVSLPISDVSVLEQTIRIDVEPNSNTQECITDNNTARAVMMQASVYDEAGESDKQLFAASIANENDAPTVISSTSITFEENAPISFVVDVNDIDVGDDHRFESVDVPAGLEIDEFSGEITSNGLAFGAYPLVVRVYDLAGAYADHSMVLSIVSATNTAPEITSVPPTSVTMGETYEYAVSATDTDDDAIEFFMSRTQAGVSIDATSGLIQWTPTQNQVGLKSLEVSVVDEQGAISKQYFLVDVIEPDLTNQVPVITSVPSGVVVAGQEFSYHVVATDPDADPITYRVISDIAAITIDHEGLLTWLPSTELIGQAIVVEVIVEDGRGGVASQKMTLPVNDSANNPPMITSTPALSVYANDAYQYVITAEDADGDAVTFELLEKPNGMKLSGNQIDWTPSSAQAGNVFNVIAKATDARGAASTQTFGITVNEQLPPNTAPSILSTPISPAFAGEEYQYAVIASDPENDPLTHTVTPALAGLAIDDNGLLTWTPTEDQLGLHQLVVRVEDGRAWVTQTFTLEVVEAQTPDENGNTNTAPEITSTPRTQAVADAEYQYQVTAIDADGDALTFAAMTIPANATFSTDGLLTWMPTQDQVGIEDIVLSVSDGNIRAIQSYSIAVFEDFLPIDAFLNVTPQNPEFGDLVDIQVLASGGRDTLVKTLTVNGTSVSLDEYGRASVLANTYGVNDVVATVTDGTDTLTESGWFSVIDPNDTTAPDVMLHSPSEGQSITEPVDVIATVNDANLREWSLIVKEVDSPASEYQVVATGNSNLTNERASTFDPTLLHNGLYSLILKAEDANGQTTFDKTVVLVEGSLKPGVVQLSFVDMTLPIAGIPIVIERTYDSRVKTSRDLGVGWDLSVRQGEYVNNREPGQGWSVANSGGFLKIPCYTAAEGAHHVTHIRISDQETYEFRPRIHLSGYGSMISGGCLGQADFVQTGGLAGAQLQVLGNNNVFYLNGQNLFTFDLGDEDFGLPWEPTDVRLTTPDGRVFDLNVQTGITRLQDLNNNQLFISENGVVNAQGIGVRFTRDAYGRIVQIEDPNGHTIQYGFDTQNNLTVFTNQLNETTTYQYHPAPYRHHLKSITLPDGRVVSEFNYDDQGRVSEACNESGCSTATYDLAGRTQTNFDATGRQKTYVYDARGNVLSVTDDLNNTIKYQYDDNNNWTQMTDAEGNITTQSWDASGNLLSRTEPYPEGADPADYTTEYQWNARNQVTSVTKPNGGRQDFSYDANGNMTQLADETGFELLARNYDSRGNLLSEQDTYGSQNFSYNSNGYMNALTIDDETVATFEYDAVGNPTRFTNQGQSSTQTFDPMGRMESANYDGVAIEFDYGYGQDWTQVESDTIPSMTRRFSPDGKPLTFDYADGSQNRWEYDAAGRVISEWNAFGGVTTYDYDAAGRLQSETDPVQGVTTYELDKNGRTTAVINPTLARRETTYTPDGRVAQVIDGSGRGWQMSYTPNSATVTDELNRAVVSTTNKHGLLTELTHADGTKRTWTYLTEHAALDGGEHPTSFTDEANRTRQYRYDDKGRLLAASDFAEQEATYAYGDQGITEMTNAIDETISLTYASNGEVAELRYADDSFKQLVRDDARRIQRVDYASGRNKTYDYDALGRVISESESGTLTKQLNYSAQGVLSSTLDGLGVTEYDYRLNGQFSEIRTSTGAAIEYRYDAAGRVIEKRLKSGAQVITTGYTYDGAGRLASVTDHQQGTTALSYDRAGRLISVVRPNGVESRYVYDLRDQILSVTHVNSANTVLRSVTYQRNIGGEPSRIEWEDGSYVEIDYDANVRVTEERFYNSEDVLEKRIAYTYNLAGMRTKKIIDGVESTYQLSAGGRLVSVSGGENKALSYNLDGQTTAITELGETTSYAYTVDGQLTRVESTEDTVSIQYDARGTRASVTHNGVQRKFLRMPGITGQYENPHAVLNSDNEIRQTYNYIGDVPLQRIENEQSTYYLTDGLGSVIGLVNEAGELVGSQTYDAFGDVVHSTGNMTVAAESGGDFRFQSQWLDAATGYYYLRARDYDPQTGRFLTADPAEPNVRQPESLNRYQFANANPYLHSDPSGRFTLVSVNISMNISATLRSIAVHIAKDYLIDKAQSVIGSVVLSAVKNFTAMSSFSPWGFVGVGPVAQAGQIWEQKIQNFVCSFVPDVAREIVWFEPSISGGFAASDGYGCPGGGGSYAAAGSSKPDFVLSKTPPSKLGRTGHRRIKAYLVGEVKLSLSTFYKAYKNGGYNENQFRQIIEFAQKRVYARTAVFLALYSGKASERAALSALLNSYAIPKGVIPVMVSAK